MVIFVIHIFKLNFSHFFLIIFFAKLFMSHDNQTEYGYASAQQPAFHYHHNTMHSK